MCFLTKRQSYVIFFYRKGMYHDTFVFVIKECNHDTNAMQFSLFREQRPPNIFCQGLFGID